MYGGGENSQILALYLQLRVLLQQLLDVRHVHLSLLRQRVQLSLQPRVVQTHLIYAHSIMPCCPMPCYPILCYAMLSYPILCYAMLSYPMSCYPILCYPILCYMLNSAMMWELPLTVGLELGAEGGHSLVYVDAGLLREKFLLFQV